MHDTTNRAFRPIPNDVKISHRNWTLDRAAKPALFIDVIIAGTDPDAPPEQTHRINFNRPASREWLNNLTAWALNTGRTVHLKGV
jgi:hypothetical protein